MLRIGADGRRSGGTCAAGAVVTGAGGVSGDAEAAVSAAARRRRAASSSNPCNQAELGELARAPPQRAGVADGELIGDLVFMHDATPASLGRRRGPTTAVASA